MGIFEETRANAREVYGIASRNLKGMMPMKSKGKSREKDDDDDSGLAY